MGNSGGSEKKSEEEYQNYLSQLTHFRKEHSLNFGKDIDLYRPSISEFNEELVVIIEYVFQDTTTPEETQSEFLNKFKGEVNLRKRLECNFLTQLQFVNYKVLSGLCFDKILCRISMEYSEIDLQKFINENQMVRSSMMGLPVANPVQILHFLCCVTEALLCLRRVGKHHGFIKPTNILMYNSKSQKPLFKLLDVSLVSDYPR